MPVLSGMRGSSDSAVYTVNPRAVTFYERMGFAARTDEVGMLLEGEALEKIGGTR